jgi:hypothetical protein
MGDNELDAFEAKLKADDAGKAPPRSSSTTRTNTMLCRHCGDELPDDAPPEVTSCTNYAN